MKLEELVDTLDEDTGAISAPLGAMSAADMDNTGGVGAASYVDPKDKKKKRKKFKVFVSELQRR